MQRIKPYTTNQVTWQSILQKNLRIPMNQREYSWGTSEISQFLGDIFDIFEEGIYFEKMGSIINLNFDGNNDIYDGQQRILTTILLLNAMGQFSEKLKTKVETLLTIDTEFDVLTVEQHKIKQKYNANKIPKIYCINPYDMEGLVRIFNNDFKSWVLYLSNVDDIDSFEEKRDYVCNVCAEKVSRKTDFIRHVKKHDNILFDIDKDNKSKLYDAFQDICKHLILKKYDQDKFVELYKFIIIDIDIQFYDCTDPEYVSRIFDWENNRGRSVESLDIIKNPLLVQIPDDKRMEIYEKWELLKHKENKIYKSNFGQKIFDIAFQIYNGYIKRKIDYRDFVSKIIKNDNTYQEVIKFFDIVEKLFDIIDQIAHDKFGRLLNNSPRICLNWEAYMWCLLPIFYQTKHIDKKLIKLFAKVYFRNIQFKNRGFNNLCYSNDFISISNNVLDDPSYNYFHHIEKCLQKNKDNNVNSQNYLQSLQNMTFKSTNATHLLLFLETCSNTDAHIVPLDFTLEHIFCQKNKDDLVKLSNIDIIGNLTLIEGKNSENGHKGNSSLGAKEYILKQPSYVGSSCKITREISKEYDSFDEKDIISRTKALSILLDELTDY